MNDTTTEIASQSDVWIRALGRVADARDALAAPGERCSCWAAAPPGSWHRALAELRETVGLVAQKKFIATMTFSGLKG